MGSIGYTTLSRQSGLLNEMQAVANNIANSATTGYRSEGLIFSEYVKSAPGQESLSMGRANIRNTSLEQGTMNQTNGTFDLAIEGEGFFMVETPAGNRLTRAGNFTPNAEGDLVTADGYRVLDAGQAPMFVPGGAESISFGADGTLSADGQQLGQIGLFVPDEDAQILREDGVMFRVEGETLPAAGAQVLQGFLEGSNVNTIHQLARMIEVQRAYEMGQSFLDHEDKRIRSAIDNLMKS
ncbi:flagellar hook-basal body complex protein [Ruegeria sp. TM1040]|jgi:flagellar basal-body rod protein FlgF|uniref:flagellar hook-basal body complex protein n=1 Tax=Rhodobacterales TaxID=204455 RepID=UPI0000462A61|nr:flagellar hook-basal body complex protein [Ruegeria sp. TM1040]ABF65693.1 Flagellar basal-body rod protein flgG [Ruegeria sp. TM1040]MDF9304214.1 flagellar hook-basal body complex protein [Tritonibacter mobilis]